MPELNSAGAKALEALLQLLPPLPTTAKEFIRWSLFIILAVVLETWTGLFAVLTGLPIRVPVNHWIALLVFAVTLGIYGKLSRWERAGHLEEQAGVAEEVVKNGGSKPPASPEEG